jgi:hypothetical protein
LLHPAERHVHAAALHPVAGRGHQFEPIALPAFGKEAKDQLLRRRNTHCL